MHAWSEFYALTGTAAATMTGLLFVALSLNAAVALAPGPRGLRRHAEQAFENYLAVLMVSLLALFPAVPAADFGRIILAATASWTLWVVVRLYQTGRTGAGGETRIKALRRQISTVIGFALVAGSAAGMAFFAHGSMNMLAAGVVVLLFSATEKSWGLLKAIALIEKTP